MTVQNMKWYRSKQAEQNKNIIENLFSCSSCDRTALVLANGYVRKNVALTYKCAVVLSLEGDGSRFASPLPRCIIEEYANDLRDMIRMLRKKLN